MQLNLCTTLCSHQGICQGLHTLQKFVSDLLQKQKIKGSLWNLCAVYAGLAGSYMYVHIIVLHADIHVHVHTGLEGGLPSGAHEPIMQAAPELRRG